MTKYLTVFLLALSFNSISQTTDCSTVVTSSIDKITGEQRKMTATYPFKGGYSLVESPVTYMQTIKDGDTTLYMSLQTLGSTLNIGGKGVIILFANGTKIERPEVKIDYSTSSYGWKYSAFMSLNQEEINLLQTNEIEIFRLYIYDAAYSIPEPGTKGAKAITKWNTMIRTYMKESLTCILN
jgi:hypothetical protein